MEYLDKNGLKKTLNKTIEWVRNLVYQATSTAPRWEIYHGNNVCSHFKIAHLSSSNMGDKIFFDEDGNCRPEFACEYKIQGDGTVLNSIQWPNKFLMNWPNNEIPVFESVKEYEIYIASGMVMSVTDITPLTEEVTFTILNDEESTFEYTITGNHYMYVDDNLRPLDEQNQPVTLAPGTHVIKMGGNFYNFMFASCSSYNHLKIDCSRARPSTLLKVAKGFTIDEIIYPEELPNREYGLDFDFKIEGTFDFSFLADSLLKYPKFKDFGNAILMNTEMMNIAHEQGDTFFEESKVSNKQLNELLRALTSNHVPLDAWDCTNAKYAGAYTYGTLYKSILMGNTHQSYDTNIYGYFVNARIYKDTEYFRCACKEVLLDLSHIYGGAVVNISFDHRTERMLLYNIPEDAVALFDYDKDNPPTIYHVGPLPDCIRERNPDLTFTRVASLDTLPFKYAPATWDDVTNYDVDVDGNIID
jgi:hypothetical protein